MIQITFAEGPIQHATLGVRARRVYRIGQMKQSPLPISFQDWDPATPMESFKAFAVFVHEQAKRILVTDKHHGEMVFFMPLSGGRNCVLL